MRESGRGRGPESRKCASRIDLSKSTHKMLLRVVVAVGSVALLHLSCRRDEENLSGDDEKRGTAERSFVQSRATDQQRPSLCGGQLLLYLCL